MNILNLFATLTEISHEIEKTTKELIDTSGDDSAFNDILEKSINNNSEQIEKDKIEKLEINEEEPEQEVTLDEDKEEEIILDFFSAEVSFKITQKQEIEEVDEEYSDIEIEETESEHINKIEFEKEEIKEKLDYAPPSEDFEIIKEELSENDTNIEIIDKEVKPIVVEAKVINTSNVEEYQKINENEKIELDLDLKENESLEESETPDFKFDERKSNSKPEYLEKNETTNNYSDVDFKPIYFNNQNAVNSQEKTESKINLELQEFDSVEIKENAEVNFTKLNSENSKLEVQTDKFIPKFEVATEVGKKGWEEGIGSKVSFMINKNINFAEIKLRPPDLGPIEVSIKFEKNDQASVTFVAQHSTTKEVLESSLPKLREMFSSEGLNLGDINVADEGQFFENKEKLEEFKRRLKLGNYDTSEEDDEEQYNISVNYTVHNGLIDLYS